MSEEKMNTNENPLTSETAESENIKTAENENIENRTTENRNTENGNAGSGSLKCGDAPAAPQGGTDAESEAAALRGGASAGAETAAAPEKEASAETGAPAGKAFEKARRFFGSGKKYERFLREEAILSRIPDEELMDYLALEQKRADTLQRARDGRDKRLLSAFQLAASLAAIVAVIALLKDEPTVLVNILYIIGVIAAMWIWKNPKEK